MLQYLLSLQKNKIHSCWSKRSSKLSFNLLIFSFDKSIDRILYYAFNFNILLYHDMIV